MSVVFACGHLGLDDQSHCSNHTADVFLPTTRLPQRVLLAQYCRCNSTNTHLIHLAAKRITLPGKLREFFAAQLYINMTPGNTCLPKAVQSLVVESVILWRSVPKLSLGHSQHHIGIWVQVTAAAPKAVTVFPTPFRMAVAVYVNPCHLHMVVAGQVNSNQLRMESLARVLSRSRHAIFKDV